VLYRHGLRPLGWEGADIADICAGLSNVPSSFWQGNMDECEDLVHRRAVAIAITSVTGVVVVSLAWTAWSLSHYYMFVRPWVKRMEKNQ